MLTKENSQDLERVQKCALRLILDQKYKNYQNALNLLNLLSLEERRNKLFLSFAKKCTTNEKI